MEIFAIKSNSKRRRSLNLPDPTLSESIALDAHRIAMRRIAWRHPKVQTRKSPSGLRDAGAKVAIGGPPEGGRRHLPINQKYHRKAQKLSATGVSLAEIPASIRQVADIVAEIDGLTGGRPGAGERAALTHWRKWTCNRLCPSLLTEFTPSACRLRRKPASSKCPSSIRISSADGGTSGSRNGLPR